MDTVIHLTSPSLASRSPQEHVCIDAAKADLVTLVAIKDSVAHTATSESALNKAMGATAGHLTCEQKFGFMHGHLPLVTLMVVIGAYLSADGIHSSGFIAVFVFGIMLGNNKTLTSYLRCMNRKTWRISHGSGNTGWPVSASCCCSTTTQWLARKLELLTQCNDRIRH
jgi:hypothetical protein